MSTTGLTVVEEAVKFILSESIVVAISYSTIFVKLSKTEIVELSSLTRKKTQFEIYKDYTKVIANDEKMVSRTTMFKLMNHLTSNGEDILTAINYISAIFVNEPCEMLQDVID